MHRGQHAVHDAHAEKDFPGLKGPRETDPPDLVRFHADERARMTRDGQQYVAGTRSMKSRYTMEESRLARSIRTDQADDLAVVDVKIHMIDRSQAAERAGEAAHIEERRMTGHARTSLPMIRRLTLAASGPTPSGLTLIKLMSRRPKMISFQSCRKRRYSSA